MAAPASVTYRFNGFRVDPVRRLLFGADGEPIPLRLKVFDVLLYLVEHPGALVAKEALLAAVWPHVVVEENNLNQAISTLRQVFGETRDQHRFIVTEPGRGYRFVASVVVVPDACEEAPGARPTVGKPISPPVTTGEDALAAAPRGERRKVLRRPAFVASAAALVVGAVLFALVSGSMPARPAPAIGTAVRVSPVTTYSGNEFGPSVSPDGSRVAFMWNGGTERTHIYVAQIGPGVPLQLSRGETGNDRDPAWSPDSNWIAFLRELDPTRFDLMVTPSLGGRERRLTSLRVRVASRDGFPLLAWTPDSRSLLFTTQREGSETVPAHGFHLLDLATGVTREFDTAVSTDVYDTSPAFSPDGQWLAFTRYHLSERLPDMMVQELGDRYAPRGAPRIVPGTEPGVLFSPSWSPDSSRLIFINDRNVLEWPVGGTARTVHAMAESSNLRTEPRRIGGVAMYWRNGTMSAVASVAQVNAELWVLPLDPETHLAVGSPRVRLSSKSAERHPDFSPDGQRLAFVSGRSGQMSLWLADANGENPQQLSNLPAYVTGYPRWSPDGKRIAFHTSGTNEDRVIYSIDVDGGAPRRLFNGCCPVGWSADGESLYVTQIGAVNTVVRVRVRDSQREPLFEGVGAVETVDGKRLLYAKSSEFGIFSRALDADLVSNTEERLVVDYVAPSSRIVPVAGGFYYLGANPAGGSGAFRFFDFDANAAHDVAPAPPSTTLGLAVSPDGRELVYSADADGDDADLQLVEFGPHPESR